MGKSTAKKEGDILKDATEMMKKRMTLALMMMMMMMMTTTMMIEQALLEYELWNPWYRT